MSSPEAYHIERVTVQELRRMFNSGGYWERVQRCEFNVVVLEQRQPDFPEHNEPPGTWSRSYSYRDKVTGDEIARVHQYDRLDGTIGASGLPDPKRLMSDGVLYRIRRDSPG